MTRVAMVRNRPHWRSVNSNPSRTRKKVTATAAAEART
jgi:hypothetical protein